MKLLGPLLVMTRQAAGQSPSSLAPSPLNTCKLPEHSLATDSTEPLAGPGTAPGAATMSCILVNVDSLNGTCSGSNKNSSHVDSSRNGNSIGDHEGPSSGDYGGQINKESSNDSNRKTDGDHESSSSDACCEPSSTSCSCSDTVPLPVTVQCPAAEASEAAMTVGAAPLLNQDSDLVDDFMVVRGPEEVIIHNSEYRRGYRASSMALCLFIIGGAVLPVPWAFSITGAVEGTVICIFVAAANVFTSDMLIRQCYKTGTSDYEQLALAIGGKAWLAVTRISIVVLLLGSMIAETQQAAEAAVSALQSVTTGLPDWLLYRDGAAWFLMALLSLAIILPLCMVKKVRSLEYAGIVGCAIVIFVTGTVIVQSICAGLPALRSEEFPVVGTTSSGNMAQFVAIVSYAFMVQPMMMPLLGEMPGPPRVQARILSLAMRFSVLGFAGGIYFLIGFFGAAWLGLSTKGNILENTILGGGVGQAVINFLMTAYICLCIPTGEICIRKILVHSILGDQNASRIRHALITTTILVVTLLAAMLWQGGSAKVLVITGSTGVLMVSYVCPIINHFMLLRRGRRVTCTKKANESALKGVLAQSHLCDISVDSEAHASARFGSTVPITIQEQPPQETIHKIGWLKGFMWMLTFEIFWPVVILLLGVTSSILAIYAAFS